MSGKKCTDKDIGALLHAYEINALSDDDLKKFEAHILSCEHCFEQVQSFETESEILRADAAVRREVRLAVDAKKVTRPSLVSGLLRYLWPDTPLVLKPALAYFAIVLLAYPAYKGIVSGGGPDGMREIQSISLIPSRSMTNAVLHSTGGKDGLITFVYPGAEVGKEYKLTIERDDGTIVMTNDAFAGFDEYETGRVVIPVDRMDDGDYRLVIGGKGASGTVQEQVYVFQIDR